MKRYAKICLKEIDVMDFSEFAHILYSVFAGGDKIENFTQNLFRQITNYAPDEESPVEDYVPSTFKAYYNGDNGIRGISKRINQRLDTEKFVNYINSFSDDVLESLSQKLKSYCSDITNFNVDLKCADMFRNIIQDAAAQTKRKKQAGLSLKEIYSKQENYKTRLILETNGICPNSGCTKPLYIKSNNDTQINCQIIQIDDSLPATEFNNLIALCPNCAEKYKLSHTLKQMQYLKEKKQQLQKEETIHEILSNTNIEDGVEQVLRQVKNLNISTASQLNLQPVKVREKIAGENNILYMKTMCFVTTYYSSIHTLMQQLSQERVFSFEEFACQIHYLYLKLRNANLTQPDIFDKLVNWLNSNTDGERDVCEVIIAYFVQDCEVFDEIPKQAV